ncbi:MAG: hypothetical protein ACI9E1_000828 [Cryomorphaceae bacterium]
MITTDEIEVRNDLFHEVNQTTPFTGLVQEMYPNGKMSSEVNDKDGKKHGVEIDWHENGIKSSEENYKDGQQQGVATKWRSGFPSPIAPGSYTRGVGDRINKIHKITRLGIIENFLFR